VRYDCKSRGPDFARAVSGKASIPLQVVSAYLALDLRGLAVASTGATGAVSRPSRRVRPLLGRGLQSGEQPPMDQRARRTRPSKPKPLGLKSSTELHALGELVAVDAGGSLALHPAPYAGTRVEVLRALAR